jgi:hypothetical protein
MFIKLNFKNKDCHTCIFFIFFVVEDKIIDVVAIDQIVCAKFLDPEVDPIFFNTILKTMVHSPCGPYNLCSPCMKYARCSKRYLKGFQELTSMDVYRYHLYRRRNNIGQRYETQGLLIDNQNVMPYNFYLGNMDAPHKYRGSVSICAIIYVHKYIYKGHDCTTMQFGCEPDEVEQYFDA